MAAAGLPQPPSAVIDGGVRVMDMKASEASQRNERGASAVEYALLVVGIAAVLVLAIAALGGSTFGLFDDSCTRIAAERPGAAC